MRNSVGPLKPLRDIWNKHIRPVIVPEPQLNLFGVRYNQMQEVLATLEPREKDRLDFFIAAAMEDAPIKDYIDYIKHIAKFCDHCASRQETSLNKGLDMTKIMRLKQSADLLVLAIRASDAAYLARVRAEMPVPDFTAIKDRVRRAEIQMLQEDILGATKNPRP